MSKTSNMWPFKKMHGLGNNFVIVDAREMTFAVNRERAQAIADRSRGIGCDQLIILRNCPEADVFMEIWNADGSRVGACGNATRCVGMILMDETDKVAISIKTDAGLLAAKRSMLGVSANMGKALTKWNEIPLAIEMDTTGGDFSFGALSSPGFVNMGNPHAVFFADDAETVDLARIGPQIETHKLFPERVNVSVASVSGKTIRLRVWERGAGITQACGSAACAALVAASRKGLVDRKATIQLDGGELRTEWLEDGTVEMAGPATLVFTGECDL